MLRPYAILAHYVFCTQIWQTSVIDTYFSTVTICWETNKGWRFTGPPWMSVRCVVTARSELRKVLFLPPPVCEFFVCVYEISREPLNGFEPNSQGRRAWSLARKSLQVKVKDQRSRSPGTKTVFFVPFGSLRAVYVWQNIFTPLVMNFILWLMLTQ